MIHNDRIDVNDRVPVYQREQIYDATELVMRYSIIPSLIDPIVCNQFTISKYCLVLHSRMWQNWKSRPSCGPEYRSTGLTLQDACGDLGTPQDAERQDTTQVMCFHFFNVRDAQVAASVPRDEPGRSKF